MGEQQSCLQDCDQPVGAPGIGGARSGHAGGGAEPPESPVPPLAAGGAQKLLTPFRLFIPGKF
jgi:hypothetical protein